MQCLSSPNMVSARACTRHGVLPTTTLTAPPWLVKRATLCLPNQVGLPDDELHRRIAIHRAVYGRYRDVVPNERTLYHLVPTRWFNAQLPIGVGADGFVTEDFHLLGGIETFSDPTELLTHANEHLHEQRGYFYVLQLDFDDVGLSLSEGGTQTEKTFRETHALSGREESKDARVRDVSKEISLFAGANESGHASDTSTDDEFVVVRSDESQSDSLSQRGMKLVRHALNVDSIQRIFLATRERGNGTDGRFVCVTPP
jgi:hypothetical protein